MNRLMLGVLLLATSVMTFANPILYVDDNLRYSLNRQVDYLLDSSMQLSLEEVRVSDDWQSIDRNTVNMGFITEALWLRFDIQAVKSNDYILHLPYPILDYLDHYSFIDGQTDLVIKTGDARNFNTRAVNHIDFVFPYRLEAGQTLSVYLRVTSQGTVDVPLRFSSKALFSQENEENILFRGFVMGILFLMLFYNLFIFVSLRDRVYGFYVLNISAFIVTSNAYDGGAFQLLWPNAPVFNEFVFPIFNGLIQVTSIVFMMELLQIWDKKTWYRKYFLVLLTIVSTFPILGALLPYSTIVPIEVSFSLIVYTSALILGMHLSFKGNRTAMYFTVAVFLFMVGLVSSNLKALGLLPTNFFTQHAYQLGFFVDMVVLSLALAQKIDIARKERSWAQKENIKNLKRYEDLYGESLLGNFQLTLDGKLVSVNKAFLDILGYSNEEELLSSNIAKDITKMSLDDASNELIIRTVKRTGKIIDFEEEVVNKNGDVIWISLSVRSVANSEGGTEYYEGSILNISERKENENIREQALKDRMATLEQLVVGICHELNTPLGTSITSISHAKSLLAEVEGILDGSKENALSLISQSHEAIELSDTNLKRVVDLIKQFKNISVNQYGYELSESNLLATISSGLVGFNKKFVDENVRVKVSCEADYIVKTYSDALSEIISQLVSNSLDHAFVGRENKTIIINVSIKNGVVELIYRDDGTGLSDAGKHDLFNPFYTTMRGYHGKVGLGMYLTFNLLTQLLNGDVEIENPEVGFSLVMKFPAEISNVVS